MTTAVAAAGRADQIDLPVEGHYFTLKEIRDLTKISLSKLYEDASGGLLGCLRRGRAIRVARKDLLAYLAGESPSTAPPRRPR